MKIAFVGLGAIGLPIARRLAASPTLELSIFDVREEVLEREAALGRVAESVGDCIAGADAIFTVLPEDAHVRAVADQVAAEGRPGQIFVDFSTVAPSTIDAVAASLAEVGISTVSAALTRSVAAAEAGELSIFVGGETDLIDRLGPALSQMATEVRRTRQLGAAKAFKIANNMVVSSLDVVICEALLVGAKRGVEPDALVEALIEGGADSWPLRNHIAKHLLVDDLGPGRFSTRYMAKDVRLAAELARSQGQPAWFTGVVSAAYRGTVAHGFGDHYHPVVMRWLERGAASEPVVPRGPGPAAGGAGNPGEAFGALVSAVVALQALITLDALNLVRPYDVSLSEAATHFESGSASNACLRGLLGSGPRHPARITFSEMVGALERACREAAEASVPGITLEMGKHLALSLGERYGSEASIASVAEENRSEGFS